MKRSFVVTIFSKHKSNKIRFVLKIRHYELGISYSGVIIFQ